MKFYSRGIGTDVTPGCFVCGGGTTAYDNIAAFVDSKTDGERIVEMFGKGVRLDYREREPNWIQVKVGACATHYSNLEELHNLTRISKEISQDTIDKATKV